MKNTITLKKAIERAKEAIVVDGTAYDLSDVEFDESEMDATIDVVSVQNPDSWDKNYGKVSLIAQGVVDGHRVIIGLN